MYIKTGNVGIGTTSPGAKLDVNGTVRGSKFTTGSVSCADDATATLVSGDIAGYIFVVSAGYEQTALFIVSTYGGVVEISDPAGAYTTTQGTDGTANIYVSGSDVIVENKLGYQSGFAISILGA